LKYEGKKKGKKGRKIRERKKRKSYARFVVVTISKRNVLIETQRMKRAVMVVT